MLSILYVVEVPLIQLLSRNQSKPTVSVFTRAALTGTISKLRLANQSVTS